MKPFYAKDLNHDNKNRACSTEGKHCGCSNGICPGTLLAGVMLVGWALWALGTWIWRLIAS